MYKFLTISALAALASAQGALPTCAEAPAITYLMGTTCGLNFQCICGNAAILNGLIPVVEKACTNPADLQSALQFASAQCETYGINIATELSTGAAAAPATSSAAPASTSAASSSAPATSSAMTSASMMASSSAAAVAGSSSQSTVTTYTTVYPSCTSSCPSSAGAAGVSTSYVSPAPSSSAVVTPVAGGAMSLQGNAVAGLVALVGAFAI